MDIDKQRIEAVRALEALAIPSSRLPRRRAARRQEWAALAGLINAHRDPQACNQDFQVRIVVQILSL